VPRLQKIPVQQRQDVKTKKSFLLVLVGCLEFSVCLLALIPAPRGPNQKVKKKKVTEKRKHKTECRNDLVVTENSHQFANNKHQASRQLGITANSARSHAILIIQDTLSLSKLCGQMSIQSAAPPSGSSSAGAAGAKKRKGGSAAKYDPLKRQQQIDPRRTKLHVNAPQNLRGYAGVMCTYEGNEGSATVGCWNASLPPKV